MGEFKTQMFTCTIFSDFFRQKAPTHYNIVLFIDQFFHTNSTLFALLHFSKNN